MKKEEEIYYKNGKYWRITEVFNEENTISSSNEFVRRYGLKPKRLNRPTAYHSRRGYYLGMKLMITEKDIKVKNTEQGVYLTAETAKGNYGQAYNLTDKTRANYVGNLATAKQRFMKFYNKFE